MSPLIETIQCNDGNLQNMRFHQARFNHTRKKIFGFTRTINLANVIKIPDECKTGLYRCRIIYTETIDKIEFIPHQYRPINRLKLVEDNTVDYQFKFADRKRLNRLFAKRGQCDDILIIKNGCITDSLIANVVFFDGCKWWTPDTPLLHGTQRARLIEETRIIPGRITPENLAGFQKAGLINAMQDLKRMPVILIENIFY